MWYILFFSIFGYYISMRKVQTRTKKGWKPLKPQKGICSYISKSRLHVKTNGNYRSSKEKVEKN